MSRHRIDPRTVKTVKAKPSVKGGQGTVTPGTIIRSEEVLAWRPEQLLKQFLEMKLAIKMLEWNRENEASANFFKVSLSSYSPSQF